MSSAGDRSTFLNVVGPWDKNVYLNVEAFLYEGGKLQPKASRATVDLNEAANFVGWADGLGYEVYIRMASQRNPGTGKTDKRGRIYYRALSGKANAVALRSFFIDVDVKAGAYGSTEEAVEAVRAFCGTVGLPLPSLVVYSGGGGFHAHWVMDRLVPLAEWEPLARKLSVACRQHGVKADHNLTVNAVCLLRVPGTHNRKYGDQRPVVLQVLGPQVTVEGFTQALSKFSDPGFSSQAPPGAPPLGSPDLTNFPARAPVSVESKFLAGIFPDPFTLEEVGRACPFVRETLATKGADQREPLWFRAGHIAAFTAGGIKDYHRMSEGHRSYTHDETEAKFSRVLATKVATDQGWPQCETIETDGAIQCATCEHRGKGKSPFNFAMRSELTQLSNNSQDAVEAGDSLNAVQFLTSSVPGYMHDPIVGIVSYQAKDKKTGAITEMPLAAWPIWDLDYLQDHDGRFAVHFNSRRAKGGFFHVVLRTDQMIDGTTLRKRLLGDYGLSLHTDAGKGLLNFMAAFKDMMRQTRDTIVKQELMGWSDEQGKAVGFIYGSTKYNCKGDVAYYQTEPFIREQYFPTGSIEPWMEAIHMINAEQRPEMDLLVATAFGAPLMRFSSEKGVVVSAFSSGTGVHKTTAIRVGQSTWGSFKGINQLNDTMNSVMEKTGKTRITPTYYDEMKSSLDVKQFIHMLYQFAGGRGKGRLSRTAEIRDVATWDTLLVGVSNDSLFDHISQEDRSTDAGVARIFEFEIRPPNPDGPGQLSMGTAGEVLKKLETNYGCAGERYAKHLGRSVEWLPGAVKSMIDSLQDELDAPSTERFWVSAAAVLLLGAQIANEIKLTKFDIPRMSDFVAMTFERMRKQRTTADLDISKQDSIRAALAEYINRNRRSIIASDTAGQPGRTGNLNPVTILNLEDIRNSNDFSIRYIQNTNTLRFSRAALMHHLNQKKLQPGVFIKNMLLFYQGRETTTNITSGTRFAGAKERVLELDCNNHPDLVNLYQVV